MELDELARIQALRGSQLMWFLGAGASVSARAPTASQMINELKLILYRSKGGVAVGASDANEPGVRQRIQDFVEALPGIPTVGHTDEYAALIEAVYSRKEDRRRYLDSRLADAQPGYANLCFAALVALDLIKVVWTTNFDPVVERACEEFGVLSRLIVVTPDTSEASVRVVTEGRTPLYAKLHGDYRYERLKNTAAEFRQQDDNLRRAFESAGQRHGIIVAGYSGRDRSVLEAFRAALNGPTPFPHGFYWVHRSVDLPSRPVKRLIQEASEHGVDAQFVRAETFEDLVTPMIALAKMPADIQKVLDPHRPKTSDNSFVLPGKRSNGSPMRLNAVEVHGYPAVARRVQSSIGGQKEVREAVVAAGNSIVAFRTRNGVLAFGSDDDVRIVFKPYGITEWAITALDADRLRLDHTREYALLYDALFGAVIRSTPLVLTPNPGPGRRTLIVDPGRIDDSALEPLREAVRAADQAEQRKFRRNVVGGTDLIGTVPGSHLRWAESLTLRLDHRFGRLWLLFRPSVWAESAPERGLKIRTHHSRDDDSPRARFLRGRLDHRYNDVADKLLTAWIRVVVPDDPNAELSLYELPSGVGVDAVFRLARRTAYARMDSAEEVRRAS